jgi:hypothetical protein
MRISYFNIFLSFNHYFTKHFKLVYKRCGYDNCNNRYNVSPVHLHAVLGVGNLRRWSACAPIDCELVRDCRNTAVGRYNTELRLPEGEQKPNRNREATVLCWIRHVTKTVDRLSMPCIHVKTSG